FRLPVFRPRLSRTLLFPLPRFGVTAFRKKRLKIDRDVMAIIELYRDPIVVLILSAYDFEADAFL
ncbi:MAG: hypothetical protein ACI9OU_002570, partial [Candidatus Promineifilaceae bacterium]